ncbi:DUF6367 family protein [Halothiobacillus sp.]|uniref:DUF6367 family protein n=1 Tax=Halothiobacillus sp. TaxID=1891311 RepID=UPI002624151E|nr:DUF6367 family protein [Halothiobacillus sp.]MDD4965379.1 DUF6367 family protein [Halothiobacillus sp.]
MKLFSIIESHNKTREPNDISILISDSVFSYSALSQVQESIWIDSDYKGWKYRVDPENPSIPLKRHVHIAKSKHTNSKNMQASWNSDGTRHDKKTFNQSIGSIKRVREIARNILKIGTEITLESYSENPNEISIINEVTLSPDGKTGHISIK